MVNRLGNLFRSHGIGRGDIVAIYLPVSPVAVATMLACARIGATHSVIFAGFSAQAVTSRIQVSICQSYVTFSSWAVVVALVVAYRTTDGEVLCSIPLLFSILSEVCL